MNTIKCKDARREIEEVGVGQQLGSFAATHIRECSECQLFRKERIRLRQLIAGLGAVEAPADFDFRLRARIARDKSNTSKDDRAWRQGLSRNAPAALVAALLLLVAIAGLFALRGRGVKTPVSATAQPDLGNTTIETKSRSQPSFPSSPEPQNGSSLAQHNERDKGAIRLDIRPVITPQTLSTHRNSIAARQGNRNTATREFGSLPAPVFKAENSMAGVGPFSSFPVKAASQSLKVSLDDGRGGARTISFPTVSFGSQRVIAGGGSPLLTSSPKDAW
jgi:hypothetical protein